jgi:hypothetical protein
MLLAEPSAKNDNCENDNHRLAAHTSSPFSPNDWVGIQ